MLAEINDFCGTLPAAAAELFEVEEDSYHLLESLGFASNQGRDAPLFVSGELVPFEVFTETGDRGERRLELVRDQTLHLLTSLFEGTLGGDVTKNREVAPAEVGHANREIT